MSSPSLSSYFVVDIPGPHLRARGITRTVDSPLIVAGAVYPVRRVPMDDLASAVDILRNSSRGDVMRCVCTLVF